MLGSFTNVVGEIVNYIPDRLFRRVFVNDGNLEARMVVLWF